MKQELTCQSPYEVLLDLPDRGENGSGRVTSFTVLLLWIILCEPNYFTELGKKSFTQRTV